MKSFRIHLDRKKRLLQCEIMAKKHKPDPAAVSLGRRGGRATAKRGPDYYRKINAMRKTRAGGRPPKKS